MMSTDMRAIKPRWGVVILVWKIAPRREDDTIDGGGCLDTCWRSGEVPEVERAHGDIRCGKRNITIGTTVSHFYLSASKTNVHLIAVVLDDRKGRAVPR